MKRRSTLGRSVRPRSVHRGRFGGGRLLGVALVLAVLCTGAGQVAGQMMGADLATIEMMADRSAYEPGTVARLAAEVEVERGWHMNSHTPTLEYLIPTVLTIEHADGTPIEAEIRYPRHEMQTFAFSEGEPLAVYDGTIHIFADVLVPEDAGQSLDLVAVLDYQACDDSSCAAPATAEASITLAVGSGGKAQHADVFGGDEVAEAAGARSGSTGGSERGLAGVLLLGLLGGLILNAMPCVLPVLSLKVFGLVKSAGEGRKHLVTGALATTLGVLVSFWALALAAIVAARAGAAIGWGIQFQQPGFVTFLAVVVVLFSLNMWGLFEIPLPQSLARLGGSGPREGLAGHFVGGLFATLMATPCSAPFLGTAVGFALGQPAAMIFLVFTAIGTGLALPYIALAIVPGAARLLPKPGAWMVTFRHVMGFLLAAAAVWLFYVLAGQITAERLAAVQLMLLLLALSVWFMRHAADRPTARRVAAFAVVLTSFASVALAVQAPPATKAGVDSGLLAWRPFDEAEAEALAQEGTPVFVDFTADWCLTCKANERAVIETEATAALFRSHGVVAMKGDWTNRDDTITEFLARHKRAAVPFYILYRPGAEPHIFGEVLTRGALAEALTASGR